jgi:hypothetical protein
VLYYAAYRMRFEDPEFMMNFQMFTRSLPVIVGAQMVASLRRRRTGACGGTSPMDTLVVTAAPSSAPLAMRSSGRLILCVSRTVFAIGAVLPLIA